MSSETSTESQLSGGDLRTPGSDALQPWQLFTLAGLVGATITVFLSRGESPAGVILLSLTVFAAAAVGIAALRTVKPLTSKAAADTTQVLGGRTRAALEREKLLVLRSIKELEFDRAMGKVSSTDHEEMVGRLRARAMSLIRQLDEGESGYRVLIERELAARLAHRKGGSQSANTQAGVPPLAEPAPQAPAGEPSAALTGRCAGCGTRNDEDATFCKRCGTRL
jgi:hypothetical protein